MKKYILILELIFPEQMKNLLKATFKISWVIPLFIISNSISNLSYKIHFVEKISFMIPKFHFICESWFEFFLFSKIRIGASELFLSRSGHSRDGVGARTNQRMRSTHIVEWDSPTRRKYHLLLTTSMSSAVDKRIIWCRDGGNFTKEAIYLKCIGKTFKILVYTC